ncbi:MAG TPA: chloride channel protein [Gammaproteobacteria bacterium]|nr:chloride channel protein [Gammaproteobacteria bacterium]
MRRQLLGYLSVRDWKTRLIFWSAALAVGGVAAAFTLASNWAMSVHDRIMAHSHWWTLLLAPLGLGSAAMITRYVFPGSEGSGIPQAIAALRSDRDELRHKVLSIRIAIGKILVALMAFVSGASIGREGPTVHIGASLMYSSGRFTRFPPHYIRHGLITAGGAAGIAAAFNTPIAGIIFAIEEMARFYEEKATGMLLVGVLIAGIVAMAVLGNYTYFGETSSSFNHVESWIAVPVCGIIGGFLGGGFSSFLVSSMRRIRNVFRKYTFLVAAACGLVIALLGLLSHGASYGTGYDQARHILEGHSDVSYVFPFYKILATIASYLSGIPGGIFSPSLSAGAGIGADLAPLMPYAPAATVVILGMTGYFTGVVQTPLTASVIMMEMVNDHAMVFPIMATAFIALGASKLLCRHPVYWSLAEDFLAITRPKPESQPIEEPNDITVRSG